MPYRLSRMTILRATDPDKFKERMCRAITKHRGVGLRAAQDLDVGISTFKRWVEEDVQLTRFLERTRKQAKAA